MYGAWGPSTWGPSPQEEAAALRAERAREEQADGFLSWLGLHPWSWVVLGPWLRVLAPGNAATLGFLCASSPANGAIVFRLAPGVSAGGLTALTPGEPVALRLDPYGQVIGVGGADIPGATAVTGMLVSVDAATGQIEVVVGGHNLAQCHPGRGQAPAGS